MSTGDLGPTFELLIEKLERNAEASARARDGFGDQAAVLLNALGRDPQVTAAVTLISSSLTTTASSTRQLVDRVRELAAGYEALKAAPVAPTSPPREPRRLPGRRRRAIH